MTITFVIGAFVIGAFLLVPLGILVTFALLREPRPPSAAEPGQRKAAPWQSSADGDPDGRMTTAG